MRRRTLAILVLGAFLLLASGGARLAHQVLVHGDHGVAGAAHIHAPDACGHGHAHGQAPTPGERNDSHHDGHSSDTKDCAICAFLATWASTTPQTMPTLVADAATVVGSVDAARHVATSTRLARLHGRAPPPRIA